MKQLIECLVNFFYGNISYIIEDNSTRIKFAIPTLIVTFKGSIPIS